LLTLLHELSEGIGAVPKISGLVEPLAAFYPRVAAGLAEQQLQTGQNSVTAFAEACVRNGLAKFHELPPAVALEFANWNSPQDRTNALKVTDFQERTAAVSKTSRSVPQ
jgi:molybdopterin-guanine dinucleotide biosynthesis protein A